MCKLVERCRCDTCPDCAKRTRQQVAHTAHMEMERRIRAEEALEEARRDIAKILESEARAMKALEGIREAIARHGCSIGVTPEQTVEAVQGVVRALEAAEAK